AHESRSNRVVPFERDVDNGIVLVVPGLLVFPTNAPVDGQLGGDFPVILGIEAEVCSPVIGDRGADLSFAGGHQSEQEIGYLVRLAGAATEGGIGGVLPVEGEPPPRYR